MLLLMGNTGRPRYLAKLITTSATNERAGAKSCRLKRQAKAPIQSNRDVIISKIYILSCVNRLLFYIIFSFIITFKKRKSAYFMVKISGSIVSVGQRELPGIFCGGLRGSLGL